MKKILTVAGARPNFMKISPFLKALRKDGSFRNVLVHTGQHYDYEMSGSFFDSLGIPSPDYNLEVGSGSHAQQTAMIMMGFEKVCEKEKPDLVVVVGDVNSTIACALVAKKLGIKVAHIEAGLRSFDERMPEEINRVLTDRISDYLFVSEDSGTRNLQDEGAAPERIHYVGNTMIDCLLMSMDSISKRDAAARLGLQKGGFAVLTLHRPSNVDDKETLSRILSVLERISRKTPILWPIHPRTKASIQRFGLQDRLDACDNIKVSEPAEYYDFMSLVKDCRFVLTDSGGIQEETSFLGIPCITMRENTERPSTLDSGLNVLVGNDEPRILSAVAAIEKDGLKKGRVPELWDGKASERIVSILRNSLS